MLLSNTCFESGALGRDKCLAMDRDNSNKAMLYDDAAAGASVVMVMMVIMVERRAAAPNATETARAPFSWREIESRAPRSSTAIMEYSRRGIISITLVLFPLAAVLFLLLVLN
jgi:hypothetical protein